MLRLGILASGNATDMQAIVDAISSHTLNASIQILICNKKDAGALVQAKKNNVMAVLIQSAGKEREVFDREVAQKLDESNIDLIVLIGYMRYLSPWFVKKYKNKIINIHPSLLPAFAGGMDKNVHQQVLDYGCKVSGCTLHFVDEGADTGSIIMQKAVEINENETVDTLKQKVQKAEQEILVKALQLFSEDRIKPSGRHVRILPP